MLGHGKREGSSSAVLEDRGPVRPEAYAVIVPPMSEPRESGEAAAPGFARILIGACQIGCTSRKIGGSSATWCRSCWRSDSRHAENRTSLSGLNRLR